MMNTEKFLFHGFLGRNEELLSVEQLSCLSYRLRLGLASLFSAIL